MRSAFITTEDFYEFKKELLEGLKEILLNHSGFSTKKWLRSQEVLDLLGISPGTLQNLRINGTIPYSRINGVLYYDYEEILHVLEQNRVNNQF